MTRASSGSRFPFGPNRAWISTPLGEHDGGDRAASHGGDVGVGEIASGGGTCRRSAEMTIGNHEARAFARSPVRATPYRCPLVISGHEPVRQAGARPTAEEQRPASPEFLAGRETGDASFGRAAYHTGLRDEGDDSPPSHVC